MAATAGAIEISWSGSVFLFDRFTDEALPRNFVQTTALTTSTTGAQILSGPPIGARFIWAFSVIVSAATAQGVQQLFVDFDAQRALGELPVIAVDDKTFGAQVSADAVFTTPPSVSRFGDGDLFLLSFGLTQV